MGSGLGFGKPLTVSSPKLTVAVWVLINPLQLVFTNLSILTVGSSYILSLKNIYMHAFHEDYPTCVSVIRDQDVNA